MIMVCMDKLGDCRILEIVKRRKEFGRKKGKEGKWAKRWVHPRSYPIQSIWSYTYTHQHPAKKRF